MMILTTIGVATLVALVSAATIAVLYNSYPIDKTPEWVENAYNFITNLVEKVLP